MDPIHHRASDLAERLHLQREFGELRATYRWFSWKRLLIYLPGTILFLFFCGVCIWLGITPPLNLGKCLYTAIMGGVLLIVGLWGLYCITAVLANRTMIEITFDQLSVRHGPLPYPGNGFVRCSELKEIRMEETSKAGIPIFVPAEGAAAWTPKGSFHQLRAILKGGRGFDLVYGSDERTMDFLRAAITQHLGLKDSIQVIPTPSVVPGSAQETRADTKTRKIEVYKRYSDSEQTAPITEMQNPDGTSMLVVGSPEGEWVPFQCPWCGQTYHTSLSGDSVFFECCKCKKRTYLTRS